MPSMTLQWGRIAETGIGNSEPLQEIHLLPGDSDGPCVGIGFGRATVEIHAEDAIRLAGALLEAAGGSRKKYESKFGAQAWR